MREHHFARRPVVAFVAEAQPFIEFASSRLHAGRLIESPQQSDYIVLRFAGPLVALTAGACAQALPLRVALTASVMAFFAHPASVLSLK
jgi:hypothetical protein